MFSTAVHQHVFCRNNAKNYRQHLRSVHSRCSSIYSYYVMCYVFAVMTCPEAPEVAHSSRNSSLAVFGIRLEYRCDAGYWFPDHNHSIIIQCEENASWSAHPENCTRKFSYFSGIHFQSPPCHASFSLIFILGFSALL